MHGRKTKVLKEFSRSMNSEKDITKNLRNGFISKGSRGESLIEQLLCHKINEVTLNCVAQVATIISKFTGIKLDRNHKRSKVLLIKWFDQNEEFINPYIKYIDVTFDDPNVKKNNENNYFDEACDAICNDLQSNCDDYFDF